MRAIVVNAPGGLEELNLTTDHPLPEPGIGQVRIKVAYSGLNFFDVLIRSGRYMRKPTYPNIIGGEVSGVVDALGEGVTSLKVGDRVSALTGSYGGYAEFAVADAGATFLLPGNVTLQQGAAYPLQVLTAWGVLFASARARKGDWVVVHAAAGGVGTALTQLASAAGCNVFATAGSEDKVQHTLAHGAAHAVNYSTDKWHVRLREVSGDHGADIICDSVGKAMLMDNLRAIARFGLIVVFGYASGDPEYPNKLLWGRSCGVSMYGLYHLTEDPVLTQRAVSETLPRIAEGKMKLVISEIFPLERAREAQERLENRGTIGKVLLEIDPTLT
ncbi:MAG: NADPH:quinone oxidoreductase family protein [bacterium]|nr:NADPH:quinone oxidoreductase family protein [bacterium]